MQPTTLPDLPITPLLADIVGHLENNDQLVLEAPPGAGKTTLVPLALLEQAWLRGQKIIVLEPRRLAARAAAERMAMLLGEPIGKTVGYRVRQESRISASTVIEVVTGGILTRWLQDDPSLEGVGIVIFDEFHERHLDADLGLALCLQSRALFRDDNPLKLLVMSATLNGQAVAELLDNAPVVRSEGRAYPVELVYDQPQSLNEDLTTRTGQAILHALQNDTGNMLVFLPGQAEIRRVLGWLEGKVAESVHLLPLFGALTLQEQRRAIEPPPAGTRKVVLATDVAESSLTIDGVRVVIDSGRSREPAFDPVSGMTRLTTRRVSQASSTQRAGRAGRLEPGRCYRLWSESQQSQLQPFNDPEILQADLAPLALQLLNWGIDNPKELDWLDSPPAAAYQQGLDLLQSLNAAAPNDAGVWLMTEHGEQMSRFPAHPRLAHMLLRAQQSQALQTGCALAAIISEPGYFKTTDIAYPLAILNGTVPCPPGLRHWRERCSRLADSFARQAPAQQVATEAAICADDAPGYLLACAYPDRVAKRREKHGLYQLSNGRSARLPEADPLITEDWLVCAEVGGLAGRAEDQIRLAAPLNPGLFDGPLQPLVAAQAVVYWDRNADRLVAEHRQQVGALVLTRKPAADLTLEDRLPVLLDLVRQQGLAILPWNDGLRQWQARVVFLSNVMPAEDNPWPPLTDSWLLDNLEQWLAPYLADVSRRADFRALDLKAILEAQLPWPLPQQLDALAPTALTVPSGSRVSLDYRHSPPILAVKLQEMFGCQSTPCVAGGRVPLVVHLLSPAGRPLQITQDLANFWRTSYEQVKKEMKGRYPKHPWPDDPLTAPPTRRVKPKGGD